MVIDDGKYYISALQEDENKIKTFRIDKMDSVNISVIDASPKPKNFNAKKFEEQTDMYCGYDSDIELLCDADIRYNIYDKFGNSVKTEKVDDKHFKVSVNTNVSPTFFGWVLGFGGKIKITGPTEVIEDYKNNLLNAYL